MPKINPKVILSRKADARIVEACKGRNVDIETASPMEVLRAYCGWVLGDPYWAEVILAVARNAGHYQLNKM